MSQASESQVVVCKHCSANLYWHRCPLCELCYAGEAEPRCAVCDGADDEELEIH